MLELTITCATNTTGSSGDDVDAAVATVVIGVAAATMHACARRGLRFCVPMRSIALDPYTHSTSGTVRVVALQDVDFAVRHPKGFCRGNNTL